MTSESRVEAGFELLVRRPQQESQIIFKRESTKRRRCCHAYLDGDACVEVAGLFQTQLRSLKGHKRKNSWALSLFACLILIYEEQPTNFPNRSTGSAFHGWARFGRHPISAAPAPLYRKSAGPWWGWQKWHVRVDEVGFDQDFLFREIRH